MEAKTAERPDLYKVRNHQPILRRFPNGGPVVNAAYLRDMLLLLPDAEAYISPMGNVYFTAPDSSEGVLLHVLTKRADPDILPPKQ